MEGGTKTRRAPRTRVRSARAKRGTQGNFPKRGTQGLQRGNRRGIEVGLQRGIHGGMKLATEPSECTDHWVSSRLGDPVGEARP